MFQGKFTTAQPRPARDRSTGGQDGLRRITWPELLAQLNAARELRSAIAGGSGGRAGSAHHIAALGKSERAVNLDDSADGKPGAAITRCRTNGAARDGREST
ncbi:hypothetical protein GRI75_00570 [Altererythrobacter soli]|uniref:Uncharacterized protein n=1 Tax=Croceibacterium soli TaxID=1739690 RepID=A0A6I4USJ1_9SPHN|nr:hypothetical protein [Croceibacterium soli]MXP40135.1 hypothetical protein [Croceibacterium soli]